MRRAFKHHAPKGSLVWSTVNTFIRINVQHLVDGKVTSTEDKYYITSIAPDALTRGQWLVVTRAHWGVENNVHWVLDASFLEDDRPWIKADPKATVVVMLLRRIAYAMLALFRVALMRGDEDRAVPWRAMLDWLYRTLIAITSAQLAQLREREGVAVRS